MCGTAYFVHINIERTFRSMMSSKYFITELGDGQALDQGTRVVDQHIYSFETPGGFGDDPLALTAAAQITLHHQCLTTRLFDRFSDR